MKSREVQFEESPVFLKSILNSALDGIMSFQSVRAADGEIQDFRWVYVNEIALSMVGLPAEKLINQQLLDIMPENKETGLFDKYKSVVETGNSVVLEQHYPGLEEDKWFKISAVKLEDGFTVTFQDISEYKTALVEADSTDERFRTLFEESMDPIFTANEQYELMDANKSLSILFGYSANELKKFSIRRLFQSEDDFSSFKALVNQSGGVDEVEFSLITKDGQVKPCCINCVLLEDAALGHRIFLGVIRDITKRKLAERGILRAEKLAVTGKIARSIAHEVRNPLTNLTLALDQLRDEVPEEVEDADLYFSIIKRNADRIGKLISDLLNSSKPKSLNRLSQPVNQVLRAALDLVTDRLKLQDMELTLDLSDEPIEYPLDTDQFRVAMVNLFVNAIEAMRPNEGHLTVQSLAEEKVILIVIRDNGRGISQENINQLFEPFYTAKKEGTGLGLTTVQNIINSHGGEIDVSSELDRGTTFTITLPR